MLKEGRDKANVPSPSRQLPCLAPHCNYRLVIGISTGMNSCRYSTALKLPQALLFVDTISTKPTAERLKNEEFKKDVTVIRGS